MGGPLRGLCGGLSEGSAGVSPRVLRGSAGLFRGFLQGGDPMLVTLRNCWKHMRLQTAMKTTTSSVSTQPTEVPSVATTVK